MFNNAPKKDVHSCDVRPPAPKPKYIDALNKELTDTDKIDTSIASNFGTRDLLHGTENYPDLVYDIVPMTADQYFKLCSIIQGYSPEILKQQISEDKYKLNHLQQVLQTHKKQFPLPYVCFDSSSELYGQEGKHRMFLLGQNYGWDKKFPVQVIQNKNERLPISRLLGEKMATQNLALGMFSPATKEKYPNIQDRIKVYKEYGLK